MKKILGDRVVKLVDGQAAVVVNRNGDYVRTLLGGEPVATYVLNPVLGEQLKTYIDEHNQEQTIVHLRSVRQDSVAARVESYEGLPLDVIVSITYRTSNPAHRVMNMPKNYPFAVHEAVAEALRTAFDAVPTQDMLVKGPRPRALSDEELLRTSNLVINRQELGVRLDDLRVTSIAGVAQRRGRVNRMLRPVWPALVPVE